MICHFERTFRFILDKSKAKLSFRNDAVCLFEMTDGFRFEMRIWLSVRYATRDFSPSVYYRKDSHFSCHIKRTDFQQTKGDFVRTVIRWKISKSYHFKRKGYFLRQMYWFWFRKDDHSLEQFRTILLYGMGRFIDLKRYMKTFLRIHQ